MTAQHPADLRTVEAAAEPDAGRLTSEELTSGCLERIRAHDAAFGAWLNEPTSKLDSARVLEETGISAPSYRMLLRRLPADAKGSWRQKLAAALGAARHAALSAGQGCPPPIDTGRTCLPSSPRA